SNQTAISVWTPSFPFVCSQASPYLNVTKLYTQLCCRLCPCLNNPSPCSFPSKQTLGSQPVQQLFFRPAPASRHHSTSTKLTGFGPSRSSRSSGIHLWAILACAATNESQKGAAKEQHTTYFLFASSTITRFRQFSAFVVR